MRVVLLLLVALVCSSGCTLLPRGVGPTGAIPNFGEVTPRFYRSAQPTAPALEELSRRGVKTIINLRMPDDVDPTEEVFARAHGIQYLSVPMHGFIAPSEEEVAHVLDVIERSPGPVLLHCKRGADRTGAIVAIYRMQRQGWSLADAMAEAMRFGLSPYQWGMKHTVRRSAPRRRRDRLAVGLTR